VASFNDSKPLLSLISQHLADQQLRFLGSFNPFKVTKGRILSAPTLREAAGRVAESRGSCRGSRNALTPLTYAISKAGFRGTQPIYGLLLLCKEKVKNETKGNGATAPIYPTS
jgi:hypothetical protein